MNLQGSVTQRRSLSFSSTESQSRATSRAFVHATLIDDPNSDAASGARQRRNSSSRRKARPKQPGNVGRSSMSSTSSLSDNTAASARNLSSSNPLSSSDGDGGRNDRSAIRRRTKKHGRERHRKPKKQRDVDREIDTALSSRSSGDDPAPPSGKAKKSQSRLRPKASTETNQTSLQDRYQPGEAVEARFGGRSKWFPGKVRLQTAV